MAKSKARSRSARVHQDADAENKTVLATKASDLSTSLGSPSTKAVHDEKPDVVSVARKLFASNKLASDDPNEEVRRSPRIARKSSVASTPVSRANSRKTSGDNTADSTPAKSPLLAKLASIFKQDAATSPMTPPIAPSAGAEASSPLRELSRQAILDSDEEDEEEAEMYTTELLLGNDLPETYSESEDDDFLPQPSAEDDDLPLDADSDIDDDEVNDVTIESHRFLQNKHDLITLELESRIKVADAKLARLAVARRAFMFISFFMVALATLYFYMLDRSPWAVSLQTVMSDMILIRDNWTRVAQNGISSAKSALDQLFVA